MRLNLRSPNVVLVTGAGSGIGRATALEFAKDKATTVVVTDIDELTARETVSVVRAGGGTAHAHQLDVTVAGEWDRLASAVAHAYGVPDVLVNNAGIVVGGSFLDHTADDWERQLGVNLFGVIHGCRVVGRQMVDRGVGGHIVNIASAASYTPVPLMPAYCVSKAGVKMLSECIRSEFGAHGIGVTAICPGFINTNIGRHGTVVGVDDDQLEAGRSVAERLMALGDRLPLDIADPSEVARAVRAAVRFDPAVVPVRPEAWIGYALSRLSPGLVRSAGRPFTGDNARRVVGWLPRTVLGLANGSTRTPQQSDQAAMAAGD